MATTDISSDLILDGRLRPRTGQPAIEESLLPSPCVQNHAANLMPLIGGDLGCVWFAGSQEGKSDISVYFSRLPAAGSSWTQPLRLSDDPARSEQNPILFPTPAGELWLVHTAQVSGNQDTALVRRRISKDNGRTWGPPHTMLDEPGTFVRQPPVVMPDGAWLLPCFLCRTTPGTKWLGDHDVSVVNISRDEGRTWRATKVPASTGLVHMNIVPLGGNHLLAVFRSRWADHIYESRSKDGGLTWSAPQPTTLPNNNSSIQATRLGDGRLALVFNNARRTTDTVRRASLYDDLDEEAAPAVTEARASLPALLRATGSREAFWGTPRAPLTLAMSSDEGHTWTIVGDLETGDGYCATNNSADKLNRELSYPSLAATPDGRLHVAFTYHRQAIKHLRMAVPEKI